MKIQKNQPKKYVITGGPGVGKTSVLEALQNRGYRVVPEAARQVIEKAQKTGTDALPWKNLQRFQNNVTALQMNLETLTWEDAFYDRGIIDGHAYATLDGIKVPGVIAEQGSRRYNLVFLLDPLQSYENDTARTETREEQLKIQKQLEKSYRKFGYDIVKVPVMPIEERTEYILNHMKRGKR